MYKHGRPSFREPISKPLPQPTNANTQCNSQESTVYLKFKDLPLNGRGGGGDACRDFGYCRHTGFHRTDRHIEIVADSSVAIPSACPRPWSPCMHLREFPEYRDSLFHQGNVLLHLLRWLP